MAATSLSFLCVYSLSSFLTADFTGVAPPATRTSTALYALVDEADMTPEMKKMMDIKDKWSTARHLSREEAAEQLDEEWLAAYNRFYERYDKDMVKMKEISEKLQKMIEPPKVERKTKGQRKRDAWAKVQAREAARAGAK